jgi:hypothetical protein
MHQYALMLVLTGSLLTLGGLYQTKPSLVHRIGADRVGTVRSVLIVIQLVTGAGSWYVSVAL